MKKYFSFFKIAALGVGALCVFNHCLIGGTGTDTPNGLANDANAYNPEASKALSLKLVNSLGHGVGGVRVTITDTGFRPDLEKKPKAVIVDSGISLISDSAGNVDFDLVAGGVYVVTGSQLNSIVIFDTLKITNPKGAALIRFALKDTRPFQGRVRLASGLRIDSGVVFIQGTEKIAKVDSTGHYDLGALPIDAAKMAIGLHYTTSTALERGPTTITSSSDSAQKSPGITDSSLANLSALKCIENPGVEKTTFSLQIMDNNTGNDLWVSDFKNPCTQP